MPPIKPGSNDLRHGYLDLVVPLHCQLSALKPIEHNLYAHVVTLYLAHVMCTQMCNMLEAASTPI